MTTSATINNWVFRFTATTLSPNLSSIPEVIDYSGFGQTNPLVDATSFDSTAREYIAGLADGDEFTVSCIYIADNAVQVAMRAAVAAKATRAMKATHTNTTTSPNRVETYSFNAVCMGWKLGPKYDDKNTIDFTYKITGAITET